MKLGSLFDGSGTAPLAAVMCGIEPAWASEIEPYPIKVTKARFPHMQHLGDITKINGAEVEPVDIICGGSPCQDLSVAGKQAGLQNGERSHLFYEMTRIIREMREATNGRYPRYIIWENVPGAFSSNNGNDFHSVLEEFAKIADPDVHVPRPPYRGKTDRLAWRYAGSIVADWGSLEWRTMDAQYWGVPQRRRRIYLVVDFGGERAGEILFEREGVRGHFAQSGAQRQGIAADVEEGTGAVHREGNCLTPWDYQSKRIYSAEGIFPTLQSKERSGQNQQAVFIAFAQNQREEARVLSECIAFHLQQDPISSDKISPCISAQRQASIGVAAFMGGQGAKAGSIAYCDDGTTPTLRSAMSGSNTVPDVVIAIEGNTIDRVCKKNGSGISKDVSPTLNTQDKHAVAYAVDCRNDVLNKELSGTIQAKSCGGQSLNYINPVLTFQETGHGWWKESEVGATLRVPNGSAALEANIAVYPEKTGPLMANSHPGSYTGQDAFSDMLPVIKDTIHSKYIVRRLTPLECCRLQGFPDWWEDGVEGSDSARYKMWGNGMALPNMLYVMQGIRDCEVRGWLSGGVSDD